MRKYVILISSCLLLLAGCGAPLFMSDSERFQPAPEIIERLRPFLADWATKPPEVTEEQRIELSKELGVSIEAGIWPNMKDGQARAVKIGLEALGDWSRGYLYVYGDVNLQNVDGWELRPVEKGLYLYNHID